MAPATVILRNPNSPIHSLFRITFAAPFWPIGPCAALLLYQYPRVVADDKLKDLERVLASAPTGPAVSVDDAAPTAPTQEPAAEGDEPTAPAPGSGSGGLHAGQRPYEQRQGEVDSDSGSDNDDYSEYQFGGCKTFPAACHLT